MASHDKNCISQLLAAQRRHVTHVWPLRGKYDTAAVEQPSENMAGMCPLLFSFLSLLHPAFWLGWLAI